MYDVCELSIPDVLLLKLSIILALDEAMDG
jgi:hypothetical protein